MKTFKEIREAYGPAAPKMKRSMGAGKGTQYRVKYDGGTNTVTAKSPDDAVKKSMKFFGVGIATKDRYMKNASAFEVRVHKIKEFFLGQGGAVILSNITFNEYVI